MFNYFFSKSDIEDGRQLAAAAHPDRNTAIDLCEAAARQHAMNPGTVSFSRFIDLGVVEHPNGRTRVQSTFTAESAIGLEAKFSITCLADTSGLIEANVQQIAK